MTNISKQFYIPGQFQDNFEISEISRQLGHLELPFSTMSSHG